MIEIETDCAEVELPDNGERVCPECGAAFMPRNGSQVCCGDECRRKRRRRQVREYLARFRRKLSPHQQMLANLRRRDALAPKPKTEIICRNGIIIERRGTCVGGTAFNPSVPISTKSYYYG